MPGECPSAMTMVNSGSLARNTVTPIAKPTTRKSTAALVSEPRSDQPMPGKSASRTVPQASHAGNREVVTGAHRRKTVKPIGEQPEADSFNRPSEPASRPVPIDTPVRAKNAHTQAEADAAHLAPKHAGGRPRVHKDRKAYKADHEKKRRAAAKLVE